jgi:hypothetical protein
MGRTPATPATTDDRCANFSASTCPTQPPLLTTSSTTDKLPLEKFHRLLDLAFWVKFLKLNSISLFVFFGEFYRVSLDPVIFCRTCGAPITRPGERATLSCPPGPRLTIAKLWYCIHCLQLFTVSYNVLHRLTSSSRARIFSVTLDGCLKVA